MRSREHPVITIDGPAGAGKSTAARLLAERLGYTLVPTGAMSRALALSVIRAGVPPREGFFARNFGPAGGRMYFTDENARRIDGARTALHEWHTAGLVNDDAFYVLLAAIIEGADRVANTAGVYAAYIKQWQPNARRPLRSVRQCDAPRTRRTRPRSPAISESWTCCTSTRRTTRGSTPGTITFQS